MYEQRAFITLLRPNPKTLCLNFYQHQSNKQKLWISHIKVQNNNNKCLAYKIMSTASTNIKSIPYAGLLHHNEIKTIKLISKQPIFDKPAKVKLLTTLIYNPEQIKDQYEIMDQFKIAENENRSIEELTLSVEYFTEGSSFVTSENRIAQYNPYISQVMDGSVTPHSMIIKSMNMASQKQIKESVNFQLDHNIQLLQQEQEQLINETRELNKQIVSFKVANEIPIEDAQIGDGQVKFSLFQLIAIAFLSTLIGLYVKD